MRYLALDVGDRRIGLAVGDDAFGLARPLRPIGSGEEPGTWRVLHLVLNPGPQRRGQRQDRRSAAFRRIAIVRTGDRYGATVEIDIALCERE